MIILISLVIILFLCIIWVYINYIKRWDDIEARILVLEKRIERKCKNEFKNDQLVMGTSSERKSERRKERRKERWATRKSSR